MTKKDFIVQLATEMARQHNIDKTWSAHIDPKHRFQEAIVAYEFVKKYFNLKDHKS